jgi:hypothetical protein
MPGHEGYNTITIQYSCQESYTTIPGQSQKSYKTITIQVRRVTIPYLVPTPVYLLCPHAKK